jgi:dihydrofolate reductase
MKLIIAIEKKSNGIGYNNKLVLKLKKDLKKFKEITTFRKNTNKINAVLMGRKTYESIPEKFRPLKNRLNIVLSTTLTPNDLPQNVKLFNNFNKMYEFIENNYNRWINNL